MGMWRPCCIAMRRLGFEKLIDGKASRERDLIVGMVAARIIAPEASKLAMTHALADTTLAEDLGVADTHEDELYAAMDWLIERQDKIEKRLARRHLKEGGLVLFDLTSSSFEGVTCPLAKIGYSRDGKPGTLQVNYGLLADSRGCPVAVSVFEGNTADPKTLLPQVEKVRNSFGIASLVMVGDRGMISNVQIEAMRKMEGVDWIAALKSGAIATLVNAGQLQPDLFDERNLISFTSEDYPGERLVACRNPELARLRAAKRKDLIAATERELQKIAGMVASGKPARRDKIGVRVGKVIGKYKMAKHFDLDIQDAALSFSVNEKRVAAEAALDGIYVIRTSAAEAEMSAGAAVLDAWPKWSGPSARSRAWTCKCVRSATGWKSASRLISSSACWPITCNGIWLKRGSRSCSQTKLRRTRRASASRWRRPSVPQPRSQRRRPGASPMAHPP